MNYLNLNPESTHPIPPELARNDLELLSCFGYLGSRNNVPFDYYRFFEFQHGRSEKEKLARQNDILSGRKVKEFTEDDFENEFSQLYGPMNKSNNKYKLLLKEYKKSRMEEMQGWVKKEEQTKILATQNNTEKRKAEELIKNNQIEKKLIDAQFTSQEIEQFSDLTIINGSNKGHDWFLLPRPKFTRKTKTPSWNIQHCANIFQVHGETKIKDVNLAVLDPLIEFPDVVNVQIGYELRILVTMRRMLNKYPMGICQEIFFKEYEKQLGYKPDLASFGFKSIEHFIDHNIDVFWLQTIRDNEEEVYSRILFPTFLRGFSCPIQETLLRVFHQIQILLFLNGGTIRSNELFDKMNEMNCGKNIIPDIKHWGFENVEVFLEFLITNFKEIGGEIKLIADPMLHRSGDRTKFLLRVHKGNERLIKLSEEYFSPKISKFSAVGIYYSEYVGQGECYRYESCEIYPGNKLNRTLPLEIFSPTKFYLIKSLEAWQNLLQQMRDIKDHFKDLDLNRTNSERSIAKLEHLRKDSIVAAYRVENGMDGGEWQRSRVVHIDRKENKVTVFGVDIANQWTLTPNEISKKYLRYLPKKFFGTKAQAIGCSLHYGTYSDAILLSTEKENVKGGDGKQHLVFKKPYKDCFIKVMKNRMFETIFLKSYYRGEDIFWEVSLGVEYECKNDKGQYTKRIMNTEKRKPKDFTCVAANFMYRALRVFLARKKAEEEKKSLEANPSLNVENVEVEQKDKVQAQSQNSKN